MTTPDPIQQKIDQQVIEAYRRHCERTGVVLFRGRYILNDEDDSVGAFLGDYDEHMRFLDWCEFSAGYVPDVCFSNVRSWEDKRVHTTAWDLFEQWQQWKSK